MLKENEILLRIGAYQKGNDQELDLALSKKDDMNEFLSQTPVESFTIKDSIINLNSIMNS